MINIAYGIYKPEISVEYCGLEYIAIKYRLI